MNQLQPWQQVVIVIVVMIVAGAAVLWIASAASSAFLPAHARVVTAADVEDVLAGCIRLTREAADG